MSGGEGGRGSHSAPFVHKALCISWQQAHASASSRDAANRISFEYTRGQNPNPPTGGECAGRRGRRARRWRAAAARRAAGRARGRHRPAARCRRRHGRRRRAAPRRHAGRDATLPTACQQRQPRQRQPRQRQRCGRGRRVLLAGQARRAHGGARLHLRGTAGAGRRAHSKPRRRRRDTGPPARPPASPATPRFATFSLPPLSTPPLVCGGAALRFCLSSTPRATGPSPGMSHERCFPSAPRSPRRPSAACASRARAATAAPPTRWGATMRSR